MTATTKYNNTLVCIDVATIVIPYAPYAMKDLISVVSFNALASTRGATKR